MANRLINILNTDFEFNDERGRLVQLVHGGYKQINVVTTKANVIRGNHYHKLNHEVFYVVSGEFELVVQKDGIKEKYNFKSGDMFEVLPFVMHSFYYIKDTVLIALYDKGVETDNGQLDTYKD